MNHQARDGNEPYKRVGPASPVEAFSGDIQPTKPSLLYKGGLACLAFAMVLLPAIYIGLIGLAAYGVIYHLQHNLWIMEGRRSGIGALILYLGPAIIGVTLVLFMVKPFFAKDPKRREPLSLDPAQEPLLFAFIQKICGLVRAPMPARVDVDCQVNASASLKNGMFSKDLVLTIGLPLANGLDMQQFAGVLAHEFGHFAQGAGMRLTYVVRSVNHWFARVVYERDEWDLNLERWAKSWDFRVSIILHAARGCIWLSRRLLWALMHAGHALSCFMMRQMEYDADSYEAKIAGSSVFQPTSEALQRLNVGMHMAMEDVRQSWASKRLPENVPFLVQQRAAHLSKDVQEKIQKSVSEQKTGTFDTHPCDADRARAVHALNQPGIFHLTQPATELFSNFPGTCRRVTEAFYRNEAQLDYSPENLISSEQALQETLANCEAEGAIARLFGTVDITIKPLFTQGVIPALGDPAAKRTEWEQACALCEQARAAAEKYSQENRTLREEMSKFGVAYHLLRAQFTVPAQDFGLPTDATSLGEQESFVAKRLAKVSSGLKQESPELEQFLQAVRYRLTCALQLLQSPEMVEHGGAEMFQEVQKLAPLLGAVGQTLPALHEMIPKIQGFTMLLQNRGNHSNPGVVDEEITRIAAELGASLNQVDQLLSGHSYPFSHAKGQISLVEYAQHDQPCDNDWIKVYHETNSRLEKLFALHFRLLGRLAALASEAEKRFEAKAVA